MRKILLSLSVIFILLGLSGCNMSILDTVTKWKYTDTSKNWIVEFTLELNETAETYKLTSKSSEVFNSNEGYKSLPPLVESGTFDKLDGFYFFTSSKGKQYKVKESNQSMEIVNLSYPTFDNNGKVIEGKMTRSCKFEQVY